MNGLRACGHMRGRLMNVNPDVGNPSWNFRYMKECMQVWLHVACQRYGVRVSEICGKIESDKLKSVIELRAKLVTACHMPLLEAKLLTKAFEMTKIKQQHVDDLEKCAKAMMYG